MTDQPDHQFKLRLPADLRARLDVSAQKNSRSLTAEIVHRLEGSFHSQELITDKNRLIYSLYNESESAKDLVQALAAEIVKKIDPDLVAEFREESKAARAKKPRAKGSPS